LTVKWITASEINTTGFNLYRSASEKGEYTQRNTSLIPAKGSNTQGASYEFVDTDVQNRKTYYCKLVDIDLNGKSTMHGPVSAPPRWSSGIVEIRRYIHLALCKKAESAMAPLLLFWLKNG